MRSNDIEGLDKSEDMMKALAKRSVFSYKYFREAFLRRMNSWWCCCCCKPKLQKRDRLFKDARSKLFEEIDILEIIKKLRVNKFTSEVFLKPRQRDLVNFFDEYKLTDVPPVAPVPKEKKPNTHHSI